MIPQLHGPSPVARRAPRRGRHGVWTGAGIAISAGGARSTLATAGCDALATAPLVRNLALHGLSSDLSDGTFKHVATSWCATAGERSPAVLAQCFATVRPAVEGKSAHGRMHQRTAYSIFALNTPLLVQASTGTPARRWTRTTTPSRTSPTRWRLIIRPPSKTCESLRTTLNLSGEQARDRATALRCGGHDATSAPPLLQVPTLPRGNLDDDEFEQGGLGSL